MIAREPTLNKPVVAREVRRSFVAAAPADAIEILSGLVDRVGRPCEGDMPAQQAVEVFTLPYRLVGSRLARFGIVGGRLDGCFVLPVPKDAVCSSHAEGLKNEGHDHEARSQKPE